jgi:hypothetical protein
VPPDDKFEYFKENTIHKTTGLMVMQITKPHTAILRRSFFGKQPVIAFL